MKRIGLSVLLFFGLICSAMAQTPQLVRQCVGTAANCVPVSSTAPTPVTTVPYAFTPLTPMQSGLAVTSSTALTVPSGTTYAVVCARGQVVNYTTDGTTTPTASVGMQLQQNSCLALSGATVVSNFRAIQTAATATLDVSYYK